MVFASAVTIQKVIAAADKLDCVRDIVLIGRQNPGPLLHSIKKLSDFISFSNNRNSPFIPARVNPNETCLVLCSSGTTGLPKGVELSHKNFMNFIHVALYETFLFLHYYIFGGDLYYLKYVIFQILFHRDGSLPEPGLCQNLLGLLPFYHGYGFALLCIGIMRGDKVIVLPRFEEDLFLKTVQDYKVKSVLTFCVGL